MPLYHDPIGKCIYCGAADGRLTDEHVIPYSLGGDRILPAASCDPCADIIKKFEQFVARDMLGALRTDQNIQTRRPKERPNAFPVYIEQPDGPSQRVEVPKAEFPVTVCLPHLPPAQYLQGLPNLETDPIDCTVVFYSKLDKFEPLARRLGNPAMAMGALNIQKFSRLISKIAHCAAVAEYGVDGFIPLAINHILGRTKGANYLVGCLEKDINLQAEPGNLHTLQSYVHKQQGIIVVELRLFANLGFPKYHVATGILKDGHKGQLI